MDDRIEKIRILAKKQGLDFFPIIFETVTPNTMYNIAAYGLPIRARHWSYGRSFDHQKNHGQMGLSKIYELIINNNPSYAFMLDNHTETQKLFIAGHCYGHSDFFKNNIMFKGTDRRMVWHAAEHADRIDKYIEKYGLDAVERIMDIAFALDRHIDINMGQYRKKYKKRKMVQVKTSSRREFDDLVRPSLLEKPSISNKIVYTKMPPKPEKDLLWFFIHYAPIEEWERDVLDMVREEAFYFYPQAMTKIMNEGWASFWHAELMYLNEDISAKEQLEFAQVHEKVLQPGNPFNINPYYLGMRIYKDIEAKWDEKYKNGESDITGREKIFKVRAEEDDVSFIRNYLSDDLIKELKLFTFGITDVNDNRNSDDAEFYEIKDRVREEVVESLVSPMYHNYVPIIAVVKASTEKIVLKHLSSEIGTLDFNYASKVLEYIWELWAADVELHVVDEDGANLVLTFDETGPSEFYPDDDDSLKFGEGV